MTRTLSFSVLAALLTLALAACEPGQNPANDNGSDGNTAAQTENTDATPQAQAPAPCDNCGTITAIEPITEKGESSGAGAAIGAVVGGLLGSQVGGGTGKDVATAVGAAGGAVAGNEAEKRRGSVTYYNVTVDLENGGQEVVKVASQRGISIGTEVEIVGNDLHVR